MVNKLDRIKQMYEKQKSKETVLSSSDESQGNRAGKTDEIKLRNWQQQSPNNLNQVMHHSNNIPFGSLFENSHASQPAPPPSLPIPFHRSNNLLSTNDLFSEVFGGAPSHSHHSFEHLSHSNLSSI